MTEAKLKGWQVNLIYVGISNVQTSINRVSQRVDRGGHNVPEEDIRRRYTRSNRNFQVAQRLADRTIIFDNSTPAGHQIILTIENGRVTSRAEELPEWLKTLLTQEIIESIVPS